MSATDEERIVAVAAAMMRRSRRAGGVVHPVDHSYGALKDGLSGRRAAGSYPTGMIHRFGLDESSMGGAVSAYWFMHDAAAFHSAATRRQASNASVSGLSGSSGRSG